eukprot:TRINITY_DN2129_c0_g1_i2.p1 TRINITY_DN2129_c0_g1~~TRINITY_DN2129_c0_g1_i2.p1  ORF type:complete len:272 (-),score=68.45 TRINITY_DN2129_c0_g1_i2:34-810(-)
MEGEEFGLKTDEEIDEILPVLQVLARSRPEDKLRLVQRLKIHDEIVGATGDGTNDALALKEANVGLAMGIAGTAVAKEAADIIIMDDNFASIVKSVLWGRSVYANIRKFLMFQLTVNVAALIVSFIGAVTGYGSPLRAVQLLWVNLIMDTMAALALATETPSPDLLLEKPHGKTEPLISNRMWKHIIGQGIYQTIILLGILYAGGHVFEVYSRSTLHYSIIFNAFVWCQIFNEFNARKINDEFNIFENIHRSYIFLNK